MNIFRRLCLPEALAKLIGVAILVSGIWISVAGAWTMDGYDARRSRTTAESLEVPLQPVWTWRAAVPPQPAWHTPEINLDRLDFDNAFHPVIADGILYFGSSADDAIRALDARTGQPLWSFMTGGPVRFAPQVYHGRVYAGSDDGRIYCLDARDGRPVWVFDAAPANELVVGQRRLISRWPVRTGVLVDDGVVYAAAGMWPSEGIFLYALDAETGRIVWCNDTSGAELVIAPHMVSTLTGVNPQGAILATDQYLVLPMGRGAPAVYDRHNGELLRYAPGLNNGTGGTLATLESDQCYMLGRNFYSPTTVHALSLPDLERIRAFDRLGTDHSVYFSDRQYSAYADSARFIVRRGQVRLRTARGMALASGTLFVGRDGEVLAEDWDSGEIRWRAPVEGRAYGLAIADGRLFVSTDQGVIHAFAPGELPSSPMVHDVAAGFPDTVLPAPNALESAVLQALKTNGTQRGYALLWGDTDGRWARRLARQTQLHVVSVLPAGAAAGLRQVLLDGTDLYGTRIAIVAHDDWQRLPFPRYFANLVLTVGPVDGIDAAELQRVLRPLGGQLIAASLPSAAGQDLVRTIADAEHDTVDTLADAPRVMRGPLPKAWDWNTDVSGDHLVAWPLRPIWFGESDPIRHHNRKFTAQTLAAAHGRFFINGEDTITALDAYNGTVLWQRPKPMQLRSANYGLAINADERHVYLMLGATVFRDRGPGVVMLDARDGRQYGVYAPFEMPDRFLLDRPRTWPIYYETNDSADRKPNGTVTVASDAEGLTLTLEIGNEMDRFAYDWQLFLDFRSHDERYGLYEDETYHYRIMPAGAGVTPLIWRSHPGGLPHEDLSVTPTRCGPMADQDKHAATVVVRVPWSGIGGLQSAPASFGFATTLNERERVSERPELQIQALPRRSAHLFSDNWADGINNGWANLVLDPAHLAEPATRPEIVRGDRNDFPAEKLRPASQAIERDVVGQRRTHPLTGMQIARSWMRSFGCGGMNHSACAVLTRGGTLSIYDFADDSGLRYFGGLRASCGVSDMAAFGVWLSADGGAGCECTYNFLTSVGFAAADRRLHEDWAWFFDWEPDSLIRHAFINLGAPGDRRDDGGDLWLGYPRPETETRMPTIPGRAGWHNIPGVWQQGMQQAMPVPLELDLTDGGGPYRINADRAGIAGTDRPWIYASGYRGALKLELPLQCSEPLVFGQLDATGASAEAVREMLVTRPADALLPASKTEVFAAFNDQAMFITLVRPPEITRLGQTRSWNRNITARDGQVWRDDSVELFLSNERFNVSLHLAASASGARYDARAEGGNPLNPRWNADWETDVRADDGQPLVFTFAIPWTTLADAGLERETLQLNLQINNRHNIGEALVRLGPNPRRDGAGQFVPVGWGRAPEIAPRRYNIRLHFAELDEVQPGQRRFDVIIQGRTVLPDFDVMQAADARRTAVTRAIDAVEAVDRLVIELVPRTELPPILSGFEIAL